MFDKNLEIKHNTFHANSITSNSLPSSSYFRYSKKQNKGERLIAPTLVINTFEVFEKHF